MVCEMSFEDSLRWSRHKTWDIDQTVATTACIPKQSLGPHRFEPNFRCLLLARPFAPIATSLLLLLLLLLPHFCSGAGSASYAARGSPHALCLGFFGACASRLENQSSRPRSAWSQTPNQPPSASQRACGRELSGDKCPKVCGMQRLGRARVGSRWPQRSSRHAKSAAHCQMRQVRRNTPGNTHRARGSGRRRRAAVSALMTARQRHCLSQEGSGSTCEGSVLATKAVESQGKGGDLPSVMSQSGRSNGQLPAKPTSTGPPEQPRMDLTGYYGPDQISWT